LDESSEGISADVFRLDVPACPTEDVTGLKQVRRETALTMTTLPVVVANSKQVAGAGNAAICTLSYKHKHITALGRFPKTSVGARPLTALGPSPGQGKAGEGEAGKHLQTRIRTLW